MNKLCILIVAIVTLFAANVYSQDEGPHDKAIKARQALMQFYAYPIGILVDMAKGNTEYDETLAVESAINLLSASTMGQSTLWPDGSDEANPVNAKTRALPTIWTTYPKVAEKGKEFKGATFELSKGAGNGLDELRKRVSAVGKSCKGCHDDFQSEE